MELYDVLVTTAIVIVSFMILRAIWNRIHNGNADYTYSCKWKYSGDPEYCYHTNCGEAFQFLSGGLKDNNFMYCPYCSRKVEEEK